MRPARSWKWSNRHPRLRGLGSRDQHGSCAALHRQKDTKANGQPVAGTIKADLPGHWSAECFDGRGVGDVRLRRTGIPGWESCGRSTIPSSAVSRTRRSGPATSSELHTQHPWRSARRAVAACRACGCQSATSPPVRFTTAPVTAAAFEEARKVANSASSASAVGRFRCADAEAWAANCSFVTP